MELEKNKKNNLRLKFQIQNDGVSALPGEGRYAPVLDVDCSPQWPWSRTPGRGEIDIENGHRKWIRFDTETISFSESAVPNPEQISPHTQLHDLFRHWLRGALPAGEAPDA